MNKNKQPIPHRRFGRTELEMPVFSCGGMRYQHSWKDEDEKDITEEGQRNLEATILRALEVGINHIETARGYGTSEVQLGRLLPDLPRDDMMVQTKVGPRENPEETVAAFRTSLSNLRLEYVDLLGVHGINTPELLDWTIRPGGVLDALEPLRRNGLFRHIGFSTHGSPETITAAIESGRFDYVNLHWYFVNPFTWPAVEAANRNDMGVFIISPNEKGGRLFDPPEKLTALCDPRTPMAFNDLFCLSRPEVHTLSIGAECPEHFDAHLEALVHWDERVELSGRIAGLLEQELAASLGTDWWENWHRGLPAYEKVPWEVNLHEILRLYNYAKGLDMVEFAKMRYNLLGNANHWFPGNHVGSVEDMHRLCRALDGYPFAGRIPSILEEAHRLLHAEPKKRLSES